MCFVEIQLERVTAIYIFRRVQKKTAEHIGKINTDQEIPVLPRNLCIQQLVKYWSTVQSGVLISDLGQNLAFMITGLDEKPPEMSIFTSLPRCTLPTSPCGVGLCIVPVPRIQFGLACTCASGYLGDPSLIQPFNAFCATCTTGAINTDLKNGRCEACPKGYYSPTVYAAYDPTERTAASSCLPCGAGRFGPEKMAKSNRSCNKCPGGKASSTIDATQVSQCIDCAAGHSADSGASTCDACEHGTFQPRSGRANCLDCVPGKFEVAQGTGCTGCLRGQYQDETGETSCKPCGKGKFQRAQGQALCLPCIPGEYNDETGLKRCKNCPINYYTDQVARQGCKACGNGTATLSNGSSMCQSCEAGTYGNACDSCAPGLYRTGSMDAAQCEKCPLGFFQNLFRQASCLPCIPGEFQNESGKTSCEMCPINTKSATIKSRNCSSCGTGRFATKEGSAVCTDCTAGKAGTPCVDCGMGKYRSSTDTQAVFCHNCPVGQYSDEKSQTRCFKCAAGKSQEAEGQSSCVDCVVGKYRAQSKSKIATECDRCTPGYFTDKTAQPFCLDCDAGKYANEEGSSKCNQCETGFYMGDKRSTGPCLVCPDSRTRPNSEQTSCIVPLPDPLVPDTSLFKIEPAPGWSAEMGARTPGRRRLASKEVEMGGDGTAARLTIRIERPSTLSSDVPVLSDTDKLEVVASSRTDFTGARVSIVDQSSYVVVSEAVDHVIVYVYVSALPTETTKAGSSNTGLWHNQMYFKVRIVPARTDSAGGKFSTRNDAWETAAKCSDTEYLSTHPDDGVGEDGKASGAAALALYAGDDSVAPVCLPCPEGANCQGEKTWGETLNKAGYQQLPWDSRAFGLCPQPAACPEGVPVNLPSNNSNATTNINATGLGCLQGHTGHLCSQCIASYQILIVGGNGTCVACPKPSEFAGILIGLVVLGLVVIAALVYDSLDGINDIVKAVEKHKNSKNRQKAHADTQIPFHSVGIRIISSYLQVAGLLRNFSVTLPESVTQLLAAQGAASGIGGQVISFACLNPTVRGADLFFLKQLTTTIILPAVLALCVLAFWSMRAICLSTCCRKEKKSNITVVDKAIGSLVILFYLMFPSIMTSVTSMLQCTSYGDSTNDRGFTIDTRILLDAELSIECYQPQHVAYIMSVAVPGMLVFVVIVPVTIIFKMRYHAKRSELLAYQPNFKANVSYRYGFLFLGYQENTYAWEVLVMVRKAAFVVVAGFLRTYGPISQVVGAVIILVISLSLHLQVLPYECRGHDRMESFSLHSSLVILLVVLLSASTDTSTNEDGSSLGPVSTIFVIGGVFGATLLFFGVSQLLILRHSHNHPGLLGVVARKVTSPNQNSFALFTRSNSSYHRKQGRHSNGEQAKKKTDVVPVVKIDKQIKVRTGNRRWCHERFRFSDFFRFVISELGPWW